MKCDYCGKTITSRRVFKVNIVKEGKPIQKRTICADCYIGNKRSEEPNYVKISEE